jgi:PHP family Zn ribbon phosphoesterase
MDYSREEILKMADATIKKYGGPAVVCVYFKFTCSHCAARCMFAEPNILHENGECSECGGTTKIEKAGFMLQVGFGFPSAPRAVQ